MRECFHVEFENNDPSKPLINCGVVYNETKGMYDLAENRIQIYVREKFLPDCSERFYHTGIPEFITKSTVEDVRKYHEKYYHPSNAVFFYYGDIPIEEVMKKVNDIISTHNVCNLKFDINLLKQPKWDEPKTIVVNDAYNPLIKNKYNQYRVFISYLSDSWKDIATFNDIKFLSALLFWGPSSPLGKMSNDSSGTSSYISDDLYNAYVFIYYMCIPIFSVNKVISLIEKALEKAYIEGFDQERYDEVIHKFEIDARKQSDFMGFKYYSRIKFSSCFGFDPHSCLDGNFFIESIHSNLKKNPKYYQELIKPLFLDIKHKLTLIVKPVKGFIESINKKITKDLINKKKQLSQKQIDQIKNNYILLKESIKKPQPVELLPSLKKSDIQVECEHDTYSEIDENIFVCSKPLNGMTYIKFFFENRI